MGREADWANPELSLATRRWRCPASSSPAPHSKSKSSPSNTGLINPENHALSIKLQESYTKLFDWSICPACSSTEIVVPLRFLYGKLGAKALLRYGAFFPEEALGNPVMKRPANRLEKALSRGGIGTLVPVKPLHKIVLQNVRIRLLNNSTVFYILLWESFYVIFHKLFMPIFTVFRVIFHINFHRSFVSIFTGSS